MDWRSTIGAGMAVMTLGMPRCYATVVMQLQEPTVPLARHHRRFLMIPGKLHLRELDIDVSAQELVIVTNRDDEPLSPYLSEVSSYWFNRYRDDGISHLQVCEGEQQVIQLSTLWYRRGTLHLASGEVPLFSESQHGRFLP